MQHLAAYGSRGMVAAGHPLAAAIGMEALRAGGNAADAAVAAAVAEWVLLPHACGPGGDAYALVRQAGGDRPRAIIGSGVAPDRMTADWFTDQGLQALHLEGPLSPSVPGVVSALGELWQRWGRLDWDRLLAPAIQLAAEGVALNPKVAHEIAGCAAKVARYPETARTFLPGGQPLAVGQVLRQPELARSLSRIARLGPADFYTGELADEVLSALHRAGGFFSGREWAAHRTEVVDAVAIDYRGRTIWSPPPPSQGFLALACLKVIEGFPINEWAPGSARLVHHLVEAKKLAFADRVAYLGDPRATGFDVHRLLTGEYASARRRNLDSLRSREVVPPGSPPERDGDTSFLCTADGDGNTVGWIHSLSGRTFGSAWTAGETGIVLNNRAGRGFTLEPGHPNRVAPGKRTMHTIGCWMVFNGDRPLWVGGTPGGDQQPQWNLQTLVALLDHGLEPATAAAAPRWASFPGTDPEHMGKPFVLRMEAGFAEESLVDLGALGHRIEQKGRWAGGGGVQLIGWREDGTLVGGSDPRAQGLVLGW